MINTKFSLQTMTQSLKHYDSINHHYSGSFMDRPIALMLILILLPCFLINIVLALCTKRSLFSLQHKIDALSRPVILHAFSCGIWVKTAVLFDIYFGKISFCGIPLTHRLSPDIQFCVMNQIKCKAGLFSLYDLHLKTGLTIMSKEQLLEQQLNGNAADYLALIIKSFMSVIFYGQEIKKPIKKPIKNNSLSLFGLNVKNTSMAEAVDWITHSQTQPNKTQIVFFINVHSINLSISDPKFFNQLSNANALFADGSGMRLAAKKAGFLLNGNNNGTDMLPHICRSCVEKNQSLYFFGAKPGIAQQAANALCNQFPGLNITGTEHGYNEDNNSEQIIESINNSGCDILLVAMGSPVQEKWLLDHRDKLQCKTALAVGGLFDFYSGNISRSPMWLREIGMEWMWRLLQEPRDKFNRYVIGNPIFLYRTFILGLVNTGEK
ncbi:WecB/TagA/CpsF family glycosyltransferase [Colwellia demingiae]|nr:WecB/TagA/CpsF family glycosyltransferase [Colwellia demingiae]